jgi:uncharacterized protein
VLLAGAGIAGGLIGTAGGITSLVTYPALLAVGIPPLSANVANLVAVVSCWPGSALVSQRELSGRSRWLRRWLPLSCGGALAGSLLLLTTPQNVFTRVVPFLVLAGAVALALQPRLLAWQQGATPDGSTPVLVAGLGAISLYNGYFGAGSGVMTLALLLLTMRASLPTANALKNMLVGAAALVSAVVFTVATHVDWAAVLPLGAGMFTGSLLGPRLTRRMPAAAVRWIVALLALVLAADLWFRPTL